MYFQIQELILWPKKPGVPPRRIRFELGKVNVITGASRTGKSAVTPIIDYCLGARTCAIPVKTIRDACAWFGVLIKTAHGEKLLARKEPGNQQGTDEMYVLDATNVVVPNEIPGKNSNADVVRRSLDELAGLTKLDFSAGNNSSTTNYSGRPSFRDLAAFVFQPQNVIANPDILFYKADTHEHRQKLRTIFPYVLDAINPEQLAKEHELQLLERDLRRKEKELREAQEVSARWLAEIRTQISAARELGLIAEATTNEMTKKEMIEILRGIVQSTDLKLNVSAKTIDASLNELSSLEKEEGEISRELTALRRRLAEMRRLRESSTDYNKALQIQRDRLKVSDWLSDQHTGNEGCPVCGHDLNRAGETLNVLIASLREVEKAAGVTSEIPAAFDLEQQRVHEEAVRSAERLEAVQIRRGALTQRSSAARDQQYQARKIERFIGNLESALALYERVGEDSALAAEVASIRERVEQLRKEVNAADTEARTKRALKMVNGIAGKLLPRLDVERPDDPMELVIDDLTIRIIGRDRDDYLWEIGSGSNWLSYHLAMIFGLQQFFLGLPHSPVPHFAIVDQPSQVYFPKQLTQRPGEEPSDPKFRDEDVEAVRKAFSVMGDVVAQAQGSFQIIVLDHAPESVWGNLPGIVLVEEWRNGVKLIPQDWIT
jgi:hypothetical protein